MKSFFAAQIVLFFFSLLTAAFSLSQLNSPSPATASTSSSTLALRASSAQNVASEMGGAFIIPAKCDADGNLYIRKFAADRPLLGPVVKIDRDGKRVALFDPAAFSQLGLDRADAFSPAPDGGMYQIAQSGGLKPQIYVLHFSSDGSPASPTRLEANLEVYTFAAFADGNVLLSGVQRDVQSKNDRGRNFTAVFTADGRELAQLSFKVPRKVSREKTPAVPRTAVLKATPKDADKAPLTLDLAEAEGGSDGNLYVMRASSPALVYVVEPSGKIRSTLKVASPMAGTAPNGFHLSGNRMALVFGNEETEIPLVVVADAQTGREIATYADMSGLGTSFACYSANDGVFTFLKLGERNELLVIRAEAQ